MSNVDIDTEGNHSIPLCQLCGQPMPKGEEMFNYHGYSGPCPQLPKHSKEWYEQKAALEEGHSVEAGPGELPTLAEIRLLIWSEAHRSDGPNEQKFVQFCETYARRWALLNRVAE